MCERVCVSVCVCERAVGGGPFLNWQFAEGQRPRGNGLDGALPSTSFSSSLMYLSFCANLLVSSSNSAS